MPFQRVQIFKCGEYHPYRVQGQINPDCDQVSRLMMDLKSSNSANHRRAIDYFENLLVRRVNSISVNQSPLANCEAIVTVVPSHRRGETSASLEELARRICNRFPAFTHEQTLTRHTTVPSAHREGGVRSVATHTGSISVINEMRVSYRQIIVIDDVTTTGSTLTACDHLLRGANARLVVPIALLETTY